MACIFPFEPELYERAGYHGAVYVGHPLHEQFAHNAIGPELRRNIRLELFPADPDAPLLAILPGSRSKEIVTHIPILRETIALLSQHGNSPHIVIPVAKNVVNHLYLQELQQLSGLILTDRNAMEIMQVADAGLIKSGTSNLQAAFCDLPFAMFFKTNRLTEFLIRNLSSLRNFSIVNIIQENSVRELLQNDCNAQALATEARRLLGDEEYRNSIRMNLQNVRMALAGHGTHPVFEASDTPSLRVARLAKEIIDQKIAL
jgi:lipid-A-disaccharide synthase